MSQITLCTLNARYIHASLGLRYLLANMGDLQSKTRLIEFNINARAMDMAESLLAAKPAIIGFGVYIWNVEETCTLVRLIRVISPETIIILGGPEVSYEYEEQQIVEHADYIVTGQADLEFAQLCSELLAGRKPVNKIIHSLPFDLASINFPYAYYTDEDIRNRVIYVEASRGCPFKCEFCLSALDKSAIPFAIDEFLMQMQMLYERGARHFKFVDRTFNLKVDTSIRIMHFFLDKIDENNSQQLFLHFELIPDHLHDRLKSVIAQFPAGSLQFEIGIQTLNPEVQQRISRKQNSEKVESNFKWLTQHSNVHIHADLIIGLPGETMSSFAEGMNRLYQMNADEIQVGILKRLRGTPIIRHTQEYDLRFNPIAPYNILSNSLIDYTDMQRLNRFARYWDMIINTGRFKYSKQLILGNQPFQQFMALSDWLYQESGQTHQISLDRLFKLIYEGVTKLFPVDTIEFENALIQDHTASALKGKPRFIKSHRQDTKSPRQQQSNQRQLRHQH